MILVIIKMIGLSDHNLTGKGTAYSSLPYIPSFHLACLDGVIKMTDNERTDLKPLEEEEVI